ncbi:putative prenylcysteine lyase [Geopyxis carbonaria]|nr:putative prenylcysteine lyase [Geopyxis carbonaria]
MASHPNRRSFLSLALLTLTLTATPASSSFLTSLFPTPRNTTATTPPPPMPPGKHLAILGAGSAGASTAYYLQQYLSNSTLHDEPLTITVFESSSHIGGRSTTVSVHGDVGLPVELGASIFVDINTNLVSAAAALNLTVGAVTGASDAAREADTDAIGVFDGAAMRFLLPPGRWRGLAAIVRRYGITAPWKVQRLTERTVGAFLQLYSAPLFPFPSLGGAVEAAGLLPATGVTGQQYLDANGIDGAGAYATELVQASTRVNYGQNLGLIHGVETMVCMAADGARAVEGGNWRIFAGMLEAAGATVRLNTTVSGVRREGGRWRVTTTGKEGKDAGEDAGEFDAVVVAAPWQFTGLSVDPPLAREPDTVPYAAVHVTLFTSPRRLDAGAFGMAAGAKAPAVVLTTLTPAEQANDTVTQGRGAGGVGGVGFFSISTLRRVTNPRTGEGEWLYKVFSPEVFGDENVAGILEKNPAEGEGVGQSEGEGVGGEGKVTTWMYRHVWQAYPYEAPRVTFEDSKLADGLWYTGGMESFISTMETNSLMGRNVARLVVDGWEKQREVEREGREKVDETEVEMEMGELKMKAKL